MAQRSALVMCKNITIMNVASVSGGERQPNQWCIWKWNIGLLFVQYSA